MAVQRFRSDTDRTRRGAGWIFIPVALLLAGALAWLDISAGRVTVTALVLFALLGGLFYAGLRLIRPKELFEIDAERRTYMVILDGSNAGSGSLDALGPLEVKKFVRGGDLNYRRDQRRTYNEYVVVAAIHSKIDLYTTRSAGKARRKMESLARAWAVPAKSLGGAVRNADQLDVPLHERLRDDPEARAVMPLSPGWGIQIEPLSLGYAMRSTFRSWAPLRTSALILVVALFALGRSSPSAFLSELRQGDDLLMQVLAGLFGVVVLVFLWLVATGIRDTFFPGTVRVTDRGVSYRGRRMSFRQIEEVTTTFPIELIGDRRSLTLGDTFCAPVAVEAVAHELQRLIIEVAEANPHARS